MGECENDNDSEEITDNKIVSKGDGFSVLIYALIFIFICAAISAVVFYFGIY